jgi:hypothetical protein
VAGRSEDALTLVKRASELSPEIAGLGADRMLPVLPMLGDLFPGRGLRRGSTVTVARGTSPGATTLMLALLAAASKLGSWCAIVGVPYLGLVAAAEMGLALERTALIPHPGAQHDKVVATLLDGFDIVVAAMPGRLSPTLRTQLAARARQHGSVLIPFRGHGGTTGQGAHPAGWPTSPAAPGELQGRDWEGADVALSTEGSTWHGLGRGQGRLRSRELTVVARGRGAAARPRKATLWLPGPPIERPRLAVVR